MLSMSVICAFCAPGALGLIISLAQRPQRWVHGFAVILPVSQTVTEIDVDR
jgi:hypothetical protein